MAEQVNVSIPQKLYRRVYELARIQKRPIDDMLIEVLDRALPPGDEQELFDYDEDNAVEKEMQAFITLHPMLKEKYLGQHVAIYDGKLIDHDQDFKSLYERIEAIYPNEFVWLATVEEEAMPTLISRSPRLFSTE
jgi:hypothetical protein